VSPTIFQIDPESREIANANADGAALKSRSRFVIDKTLDDIRNFLLTMFFLI
jgi:hypothetical protein